MGTDSGREDTGKGRLYQGFMCTPKRHWVGDMNEFSLNIPGIHLQSMRSTGEGRQEGLC